MNPEQLNRTTRRHAALAGPLYFMELFVASPRQEFGLLLACLCLHYLYRVRLSELRTERLSNLSLALRLFAGAYLAGSVLFFSLRLLMGHPLFYLFRMFTYPSTHPFSYIALLALFFGVYGVVWIRKVGVSKEPWLGVLKFLLLSSLIVLSAAPLGGILWVIHDWHHGFFPGFRRALDACLWGARTGVMVGPLILVASQPLTSLALLFSWFWLNSHSGVSKNPVSESLDE